MVMALIGTIMIIKKDLKKNFEKYKKKRTCG